MKLFAIILVLLLTGCGGGGSPAAPGVSIPASVNTNATPAPSNGSTTVTVTLPLTLTVVPDTATIVAGQSVPIVVTYPGSPQPSYYTWKIKGNITNAFAQHEGTTPIPAIGNATMISTPAAMSITCAGTVSGQYDLQAYDANGNEMLGAVGQLRLTYDC